MIIDAMKPGESYVYYTGDLGFDREEFRKKNDNTLDLIADMVWKAYIAGDLLLTCRRLESPKPGQFRGEYIATKTTEKRPVEWRGGINILKIKIQRN